MKSIVMLIITSLQCLTGHGLGASVDDSTLWRIPECDATNCAYLLATATGIDVEWSDLKRRISRQGESTSLLTIKNVLGEVGVEAVVKKLDFVHLVESRQPAIVLMDDSRMAGSNFVYVINVTSASVVLVNGGSATLGEISKEDFLRRWSGHSLVVNREKKKHWTQHKLVPETVLALLLVVGYGLVRVRI